MKTEKSISYRLFLLLVYISLVAVSLMAIVPFILSIVVSVTDEKEIIMNGYSFFPKKFSAQAYEMVFGENWVFDAYKITLIVTVLGTILCVVLSSMIAYAISMQKVKYRNNIAMYLFIPMVFNAGLVPWYLWVSGTLHLRNTIWALILPGMINPFWIFLLRNYFKTIPESLSESAEIDGAGPIYTFFKIILPLAKPIIATVVLFASLHYWNDYVNALWLIDKQELYPLQYMLYKIKALISFMKEHGGSMSEGNAIMPSETIQMATFIIVLGPIVLVYPAIQKYFVKGIMVGAVKG